MITKEEIRIGNMVFSLFNNCKIVEIYENKVLVEFITGKQETYKYGYITPIPLTAEVLEKCGFKDIKSSYPIFHCDRKNHDYEFEIAADRLYYGFYSDNGFIQESAPIDFLHELQNLMRALTGEELPITL